ncbi:hypothetical protein SDC9_188737 [bioreactor metagenome]|uniref:Uncharacterized protein n=1 Tax=bioreactor metagenome TaxID=1076179 RepID=A0A645HQ62_9ZZZZ
MGPNENISISIFLYLNPIQAEPLRHKGGQAGVHLLIDQGLVEIIPGIIARRHGGRRQGLILSVTPHGDIQLLIVPAEYMVPHLQAHRLGRQAQRQRPR